MYYAHSLSLEGQEPPLPEGFVKKELKILEKQSSERCAQRTYDFKMKRLDNGAKRNRRQGVKGDISATFRRYEAIIALQEAQLKSEFYQRKAAEAETAAAMAEAAFWKRLPSRRGASL